MSDVNSKLEEQLVAECQKLRTTMSSYAAALANDNSASQQRMFLESYRYTDIELTRKMQKLFKLRKGK